MDETVLKKVGLPTDGKVDLEQWNKFLELKKEAKDSITIGLVGKYVELQDAYKSIDESLMQSAIYNKHKLNLVSIHSEKVTEDNVAELLSPLDAVVVCPGFGSRGIDGKLTALKYTRENNIPTLGICLGMQCMVIEFARNILGFKEAHTTEIQQNTPYKVVDIMEAQKSITEMGGSMRLGGFNCNLKEGSKIAKAYGKEFIRERHRHRFEFNSQYKNDFEDKGLQCVGENPETSLVEAVELDGHPWYIGVQYHPEYSSTVINPNPLFMDFMRAAIEYKNRKF